jgi:hypothetical protein
MKNDTPCNSGVEWLAVRFLEASFCDPACGISGEAKSLSHFNQDPSVAGQYNCKILEHRAVMQKI